MNSSSTTENMMNLHKKKKIIIIGAGLGGISAAASLAADGFHVEIFEKNNHIGGKLNLYQKDGFSFDLGPSILILPQIFERLFKQAGKEINDYLSFEEIDPQWRCFFEDGSVFDLSSDLKKLETMLCQFGNNESEAFFRFLSHSRRLYHFAVETYFDKAYEDFMSYLKGYNPFGLVVRTDLFRSMSQGIRHYIKEPHLRDIMEYFIKYVGSSATDAPGILNLLPYSQLGYGLWYVKGGMHKLTLGLKRLLEDLGVKIHLNQEIKRIVKQNDRLTGVITKDDTPIDADIIISNMEVIPAYERLLGENRAFLKKYEKYEPSCSGLVIHLALDKHYPQLHHHCFFFSKNQRKNFDTVFRKKKLPEDPTLYVVAPCVTDKGLAPEGYSILKILPHIPHLQEKPPEPREYDAFKERVYDKLDRMGLSDIRRHILFEHIMTPQDIQNMYYSNKGSIYGVVAHRFKNLGFKAPRKSEKYNNLYFVGGSVNPGAGMCMVFLGGQQVRNQIIHDLK